MVGRERRAEEELEEAELDLDEVEERDGDKYWVEEMRLSRSSCCECSRRYFWSVIALSGLRFVGDAR